MGTFRSYFKSHCTIRHASLEGITAQHKQYWYGMCTVLVVVLKMAKKCLSAQSVKFTCVCVFSNKWFGQLHGLPGLRSPVTGVYTINFTLISFDTYNFVNVALTFFSLWPLVQTPKSQWRFMSSTSGWPRSTSKSRQRLLSLYGESKWGEN